jgi:targeting protein for Xklp2
MTEPRTPTLHTKMRGKEHESKWRQKLDEMSQKAKENAEFRAKEATVLYKLPFIAAKPNRPMTEVSNFVLHTEMRSKQRAKFDTELEQQEQRREQENRERQAITEAEKAKKMAAMRRSMVHKALPISHYTSTVIKPSSKPLTAPHSPHFHIRLRGLH